MSDSVFQGRSPRLWLRLEQHDDKAFYANVAEVGDGIIVNSNLAESSATTTVSFVDKLAKPFVFDPVSYRFGEAAWLFNAETGNQKRNYDRLWRKLANGVTAWEGNPLADSGRVRDLSPGDVSKYCRNNLDYQDCQLRHAWIDEAAAFIGMDSLFGTFSPQAYAAPYAILHGATAIDDVRVLEQLTRTTVELARPRSVIATVAMEPAFLDDAAACRDLGRKLARSEASAAWVWIIGLTTLELADKPARFTNYVRLIRALADSGIEVGILYGGYLAALMRYVGVRAISHGLMYGEVRSLLPSGGGPTPSFYWPPLHRFIPYERARALIEGMSTDDYLTRICSCEICRALIDQSGQLDRLLESTRPERANRDFPIRSSLELNRFHFLLNRGREMDYLRTAYLPDAISQLLEAADSYGDSNREPLKTWAARLESA